ncbi:hypothetical protein CgunFtcFv8_021685 [Champsocephalus gunnari]|uniref:Uncharacterized protein n=1 Tax=Champsocephalus gunnari TaxID=52237 RepID=A0AAN8DNG0_CHAGU|nr:hypothetical protein CgunFtcFv8_021685 [Champsocephalus gunnari]
MLWVGGAKRERGWASKQAYVFRKGGGSGAYLAYFRSHSSLVQDAFFFLEIGLSSQTDNDQGRERKVNKTLFFPSFP